MVFFRATRSDAKSDVRKGKALPARRFESVRRHSQERLRTPLSLRGLDRIETVIRDETGKKGGIEIEARPVQELVIPLRQRLLDRTSHSGLLARFDRTARKWPRHAPQRRSCWGRYRTDNAALRLPTQRRQAFLNKLDIPALTAADVSTDDTAILGFRFERLALPMRWPDRGLLESPALRSARRRRVR
jgi:hypothetical protein